MIIQFNWINWIERMLNFHLFISSSSFQKLTALVIYPERIYQQFIYLSYLLLGSFFIKNSSGLKRGLLMNHGNQFSLTCYRLR